jgi:uncharacterized protein
VSNQTGDAAKFPDWMYLDVDFLVEHALADMVAGKAISVPGAMYKGLTSASSMTPRWLKRRAASIVQRMR